MGDDSDNAGWCPVMGAGGESVWNDLVFSYCLMLWVSQPLAGEKWGTHGSYCLPREDVVCSRDIEQFTEGKKQEADKEQVRLRWSKVYRGRKGGDMLKTWKAERTCGQWACIQGLYYCTIRRVDR